MQLTPFGIVTVTVHVSPDLLAKTSSSEPLSARPTAAGASWYFVGKVLDQIDPLHAGRSLRLLGLSRRWPIS